MHKLMSIKILLDVRQKPLNSFCRSLLRYDILEDSSLCFLLFQCYQPVVPIRRVVVVLVVGSPQIYANEHGQGSCDCRFLRTVMVAGYVMMLQECRRQSTGYSLDQK